VQLRNASVYHEAHRALHEIDIEVRAAQCWVISGANGSGKSTLLRTIYGDHAVASDGMIWRRGVVPGVPLEEFKRIVGFVAPHLQSDYPRATTALEVVVSGRHASIGLNERMTRADALAARRALRQFELGALADRPLAELSYGQVRRVLFARAWVRSPKLLLLDEPFAGIDPQTREVLRARIEAFVENGGACVIATHHRGEWPANATHQLLLRAGRAVRSGPIK
jgi:ABC-type molybdenum transport system ATPase subunit/photorepair protein PhrA